MYTRAVTRKSLTDALARVFVPGIKFDYMLVLLGKQGIYRAVKTEKNRYKHMYINQYTPL